MRIRKAGAVVTLFALLFLFFCPIAGHAYYFDEEFSSLNTTKWEVQRDNTPSSEPYVDSGELVVEEPPNSYLYLSTLISKTQVFPESGDFDLIVRFKFTRLGGHGDGIGIWTQDNQPTGMAIWGDSNGLRVIYGSDSDFYLITDYNAYHTVTYKIREQRVIVFVDGTQIGSSTLEHRPAKIWMGNFLYGGSVRGSWSSFRVDYIRVKEPIHCQCQNGDIFCLCDHQGNVIPNGSTLQYGRLYCIGTGAQKVEVVNDDNGFRPYGEWCDQSGGSCHQYDYSIPYETGGWISEITPSDPHCFVLNRPYGSAPSGYPYRWMTAKKVDSDRNIITVRVTTDSGTTEQQVTLSDYFKFPVSGDESNILALYDDQGNIVPVGGRVNPGKSYTFAITEESGLENVRFQHDGHVDHIRFYAAWCNEDGTDCTEGNPISDEKYELGSLTFSFDDSVFGSPPDAEHNYKWIISKLITETGCPIPYEVTATYSDPYSQQVPLDPFKFKYRVLSCSLPSSFTKLNGTGYAPYASTLNVDNTQDGQTYTFVIKKDGQSYTQVNSGSSIMLTEPGTYSATLVVACNGGQDELPAGQVTVQENPVSISLSGDQNPLTLTSQTYSVDISGNEANNHFTGTIQWPDGTENSLDFTDAQITSSKDITFTSTEQKRLNVQICIPEVEEQTGNQYCLNKELVINPQSLTPQISISTGKSSNFVGETPPDSATVTFSWDSQHRDSITQQFTLEFELKRGGNVLFSDQKSFTASDDSVMVTFSDSVKETLSTTSGAYTLYAKVYPEGHEEDMAEDAAMTYTVNDVSVSLSIDGPTSVDITQDQTAQFTVNAQISPQDSPYTLAQATYSIPELGISDQPVENGTITIDLSQAGKTRLTINAKVCIEGLTDRCAEDHKILAISIPEPQISITCPQEAKAGEDVTCTASATADYGTAQISWLVDGQAVEGDGNEFTYAFSQAGDHTITAVASLSEFPEVSKQAQASISITNPQIQISAFQCVPADTFSDLWRDEGICALRKQGESAGFVKIALSGSIHSLTPVITIQDADGNTIVTKTITDSSNTVNLTAQELGISELLTEKQFTIQATLQEAPDVADSKQISVVLVPPDPQFEISHEVTTGKAIIHISIPDFSEQTYGSTWSASVQGQRSAEQRTTDLVDFSDGSVDVDFPFWNSGQYRLFPRVYLRASGGQILKTFLLSAIDVEANMGNPIGVGLKSFPGPEGFAPFSTTVKAYISPGDTRKVKGLEWFLDGESIAGSADEVVNSVDLTFNEPGEHTLYLKAYHKDSDQVDAIQGITLKAHTLPPDVQDAFELSLSYTRDKKVQVREKKLLKADQLVSSPIKERLTTFSWDVVDADGNKLFSGTSNRTMWIIDMGDVDLSKDYRLIAYWHTNIGRNFIASADIDEQLIKSKGVDLSKSEVKFSRSAWYHQFFLGGVPSVALRLANLKVHFKAIDSDGEVVKEADSLLRLTKSEIPQSAYTVKCEVTDKDSGEVLWQGEKQVDGSGSNNNNNSNNNNGNNNNSNDEDSYAERFANEPILVCNLLDPFDKRVICVIDRMYHLGFFKGRGYQINYCISVDNKKECGKRRVDFTFQNGGDKQFTMDFTYSKGEESNTVTKSVTLHIPDSLEEILADPEKGMALDVQIVEPIANKIKAMAYLKDRYYSSAFARRYLFQLKLLNSQGEEIFKPKRGRFFFYYEIPPSYEDQYTVVAEVYAKNNPNAESIYAKQVDFCIQTLRDNMAKLIVEKPEHRKYDPWGVYKFTVKINPAQISRYLGWDVILKDSQGQEVERFERKGRKVLRLPGPGTYTFGLKVYAKDDPETIFLEKSQQITAENQKPEVNITNIETLVDYRGRHTLMAEIDFSDPDGRIKKVEVNACGYKKPKHYRRNVFDCGENTSTEVSVKVCDDAGECTELSQPVQWQ